MERFFKLRILIAELHQNQAKEFLEITREIEKALKGSVIEREQELINELLSEVTEDLKLSLRRRRSLQSQPFLELVISNT